MEPETLVEASRAGDRRAFSRIVATYQGLVCSVAYSLTGDLHQSEDIAQETFVAAWQRMNDLRDPRRLPAWLCGIARNMARSAFRRSQRDPLFESVALEDRQVVEAEVEPASMEESDRLALVWQTLAGIPEEYREPLVLFYREGQSIRDVAAAMDLSEDCVKQRLSRGRKMMKEHVARLVEDTLEQTRPGAAFTSSVMAALPLMTAPMGMAATLTGGGSATGKAVAGAKLATAVGGLGGPLIGITGGFFGMWASIRNSATLRLRRAMLVCCNITYAFVWVFLGYEALCGILFWKNPSLMYTLCCVGWAVYIPLLFCLIWFSNRWGMRIAKEDAGQLPAPTAPLEQSYLARTRVWYSFVGTFPFAVLGSAAVALWIRSMPWTRHIWPGVFGMAVIVHCMYLALFRKGMAIAHDEEAFQANPPARNLSKTFSAPRARTGFYNDLAALGGSIFGPMAPAFGASISSGRYLLAGLMYILCMSALLFGLWMRTTPKGRRWGYLMVCLYMGVVCGVCTAMNGPYELFPGQGPEIAGYAAGLIPFVLAWCIGIALFFGLKPQGTLQSPKE
jgi:RNA polymerase sigma factor (sigma-70 family)